MLQGLKANKVVGGLVAIGAGITVVVVGVIGGLLWAFDVIKF